MRSEFRLIAAALVMAQVRSALQAQSSSPRWTDGSVTTKTPSPVDWIVRCYMLVTGSSAAIAERLGDMFVSGKRSAPLPLTGRVRKTS
jgi:hypothetical protein